MHGRLLLCRCRCCLSACVALLPCRVVSAGLAWCQAHAGGIHRRIMLAGQHAFPCFFIEPLIQSADGQTLQATQVWIVHCGRRLEPLVWLSSRLHTLMSPCATGGYSVEVWRLTLSRCIYRSALSNPSLVGQHDGIHCEYSLLQRRVTHAALDGMVLTSSVHHTGACHPSHLRIPCTPSEASHGRVQV